LRAAGFASRTAENNSRRSFNPAHDNAQKAADKGGKKDRPNPDAETAHMPALLERTYPVSASLEHDPIKTNRIML
jgi:hypothetical protein